MGDLNPVEDLLALVEELLILVYGLVSRRLLVLLGCLLILNRPGFIIGHYYYYKGISGILKIKLYIQTHQYHFIYTST